MCAALLAGCGKIEENNEAMTGTTEAAEAVETMMQEQESKVQTTPAVLALEEEDLSVQEKGMTYGKLLIEFPTEITIEEAESETQGTTVKLIGAQAWDEAALPIAPCIRLNHYKAEYKNNKGLISALLDLFPEAEVTGKYSREAQKEYGYQIMDEYYRYFVFVREEDMYIVEELCAEDTYSFGYLFQEEEKVSWADSGDKVGTWENQYLSYRKVRPEKDVTFFCLHDYSGEKDKLYLYMDNQFEKPYQIIDDCGGVGQDNFVDMNFDGSTDLSLPQKYYLWNSEKKAYEIIDVDAELKEASGSKKEYFPETEKIWTCDIHYVEGSWDFAEETETIWQWEGKKPVKVRECKFLENEQGVRIYCYEKTPENLLFDEFISDEEWEESREKVQGLYERFYEGLVPKETYALRHDRMAKKCIPQELVDELTSVILKGTEKTYLKAIINDRELTEEELIKIAENSLDIRMEMITVRQWSGECVMVEADLDNDGIDDILTESYYGGSGGFTDFVLFKGQPDGTYKGTTSFSSVMQEFGVIQYNGKNYLCTTDFDYSKKIYNGLTIYCYENGKLVEDAALRLTPESYEVKIEECADEIYVSLAESTAEQSLSYKKLVDTYENVLGGAEQCIEADDKKGCKSDIDNDGNMETYSKWIWTPSNMGTSEGLIFFVSDEEEDAGSKQADEAIHYGAGEESNPIMMWVDASKSGNIVSVMYRTGLDDFEIIGYLVSESGYEKVYRITADVLYKVTEKRNSPYQKPYNPAAAGMF